MLHPLLFYPSPPHVFGQDQWTSRQGRVEQSPKPLVILTFNHVDVRSVSLTVCRTTQPKQSQTLQLYLMKETWRPVRPHGVCVGSGSSSMNQLAFRATEEPSLIDVNSPE